MKTTLTNFLIFISILFTCESSYCQNGDNKLLQVRIAPFNLIDPLTGVLQFGLQKRFSQRIAFSFDYGFRFNILSPYSYNTERKDYRYSKSKIEVKYYTKLKMQSLTSSTHPYFSIQGFYFPQQYRKENSWILRDNKSYHYEYSNINREVMAGSIIIGTEKVKGHITFDKYFGIGIRKMTIHHRTNGEKEGFMSYPVEQLFRSIDLQEGIFYRPHISLGLKVGYILNK